MTQPDSSLRTTFDEAAERYDRARPGYPVEALDDLPALAGLSPGARILEIGCATRPATIPPAERGYDIRISVRTPLYTPRS